MAKRCLKLINRKQIHNQIKRGRVKSKKKVAITNTENKRTAAAATGDAVCLRLPQASRTSFHRDVYCARRTRSGMKGRNPWRCQPGGGVFVSHASTCSRRSSCRCRDRSGQRNCRRARGPVPRNRLHQFARRCGTSTTRRI